MLNQLGAEKDRVTVYFSSKELMSAFVRYWKPGAILSTYNRNEKGQWLRETIPTELMDGPHIHRLRFMVVRWSDLLQRLSNQPRLSLPSTPGAPAAPVLIPVDVDW